ncbi:MAG: DUF3394 domain-containing protein, partial [Pseudomonadales bacterium]|nr:DUF3394 domain-containing protein [Pseudomonadales bacterium]
GLPTTANYIVVSSLLAPVIVSLGQDAGLIVPLIAVHLFVFYFGIMADVTPPVGLASFAAAAISGGDPIKTGFQAFAYSLRTAALPFLFIFNTDLLLIDVGWLEGIQVFVVATMAMLIFAAATQGQFVARSKKYESAILLLIAFSLFRPGFWMDRIVDPYISLPPVDFVQGLDELQPAAGTELRIWIDGEDEVGNPRSFMTILALPAGENAQARLLTAGIELLQTDSGLIVDFVEYDSTASEAGLAFDQIISSVDVPGNQPAKQWIYIPTLILLMLVIVVQRRRKNDPGMDAAVAA